MENQHLLKDYSAQEKSAYLGAIASIATADRSASDEELNYLNLLSSSAGLTEDQQQSVLNAAQQTTDTQLKSYLDTLKSSELKYSLITDLLNFAKADADFSDEEKVKIENIAQYLGIEQNQYQVLNQFVDKTADSQINPEEVMQSNYLSSLGMEDKFKKAGINFGSIGKGILGFLAPLILSKVMGSGMGMGNNSGLGGGFGSGMNNGGLGGALGGMLSGLGGGGSMNSGMGGLGGILSGLGGGGTNSGTGGGFGGVLSGLGGGGGLGSLISVLSGGRGLGNAGGVLSSIF